MSTPKNEPYKVEQRRIKAELRGRRPVHRPGPAFHNVTHRTHDSMFMHSDGTPTKVGAHWAQDRLGMLGSRVRRDKRPYQSGRRGAGQ